MSSNKIFYNHYTWINCFVFFWKRSSTGSPKNWELTDNFCSQHNSAIQSNYFYFEDTTTLIKFWWSIFLLLQDLVCFKVWRSVESFPISEIKENVKIVGMIKIRGVAQFTVLSFLYFFVSSSGKGSFKSVKLLHFL